jgi:hypothetical protein
MLDLDGAISILLRKKLLGEALLKEICEKTKELLMRESNVVHIQAPVTVVGDIHGWVLTMQSFRLCVCTDEEHPDFSSPPLRYIPRHPGHLHSAPRLPANSTT